MVFRLKMKGASVVVFALLGLYCVTALPATSKQIDDSIEFVPRKETHGEQPIIDTGVGFGYGPFSSNPFSGLYENIESLMTRVRQQMESIMNRFPGFRTGNSSVEIPDFNSFGELPPFPQFDDVDLGKGNTTSETKIIDGHKVVINQTEFKKDTPNGSAFYKLRVIDVKPQDFHTEKDTTQTITTSPAIPERKDREPLENSVENEIYKNTEVGTDSAPEKLTAP